MCLCQVKENRNQCDLLIYTEKDEPGEVEFKKKKKWRRETVNGLEARELEEG